jgi:hypothetical protein
VIGIEPGVRQHLRRWTSEAGAQPPRLDRILVHKHEEENVFVSRLERIAGEDDAFLAQLALSA